MEEFKFLGIQAIIAGESANQGLILCNEDVVSVSRGEPSQTSNSWFAGHEVWIVTERFQVQMVETSFLCRVVGLSVTDGGAPSSGCRVEPSSASVT